MSIKSRILELPISDKTKEGLSSFYHGLHDPALKAFLACVSMSRKALWEKNERKEDLKVLSKFKPVEEIIPMHISSWHHGSAYFRIKTEDGDYFVKKESNSKIVEREVSFFQLVESADNRIKTLFPKMYYSAHENDASYIISTYIDQSESNENVIKLLSQKEQGILINQIIELIRWMRQVGLCHNDIRLDNFFISRDHLILFDFGYSCFYEDREKFLSSLSNEELAKLNKHNRVGKFISDDAFSFYYIIKAICPDFMNKYRNVWNEINSYMGERVLQKIL